MKTKKMLTFQKLSEIAGGFYKFQRGKAAGLSGYFYWMSKIISDDERRELNEYDNVHTLNSRCEYAPEILHNVVFLADKAF